MIRRNCGADFLAPCVSRDFGSSPSDKLLFFRMSRIGLIAGNGRFPFLVLQGARSLGHDVTVVAIKEEAFPDLERRRARRGADFHWVSLGQLGKCIKILKAAGASRGGDGGAGQAREDLLRHHAGLHAALRLDAV